MIASAPAMSRYLGKNFLVHFALLILLMLGIFFVFNIVELSRRAGKAGDVPFDTVVLMASLQLAEVYQQILPFAVMFGAIYTCWKLNKTSELVVMRSAGISVWQFLSPLILAAILLGIFTTTVINPVASIFVKKYEKMERLYLEREDSPITVSKTGIWLRQPSETGYALIRAENLNQKQWKMTRVSIFFFDNDDTFLRRIDAPYATLNPGQWKIWKPTIHERAGSETLNDYEIPTSLTAGKIEESLSDPDTISFWDIPGYIRIMEETGFPATRLSIHFQSLLAQPFLFAAMILLAATFSLRPTRFGGTGIMIVLGVSAGFLIFFMESMLNAFGVSQKIPAYLAAWTPAIVSLLFGASALLHLEDG